ncbi:PTS system mannose/fructose/sorbose family transporter subunit IID [bacterium]|nr:PTS system mannose/fructose/sorbose family transporter subunit IID [bacterium]
MSAPGAARARLPLGLRGRVFVRSLALQASWNHERMQNLGLLVSLLPWLRSRRRDLMSDRVFCRRYYEFFNTNPYLANFVIGGLLRLEEDRAGGAPMPPGMAAKMRDSLGRAFASLGDQLFWLGIRPALTMAICLAGLAGRMGVIMGLVAAFGVGQLVLRWVSLDRGYALGFDLVDLLHHRHWHRGIAAAERVAMLLTGMTAGAYLAKVAAPGIPVDDGLLWTGVGLGLVLPAVLRRRLPGEVLIFVAVALALVLAFAVWFAGG